MFRRDDSMKSFRLAKAKNPVGRPRINNSFKLRNDLPSFKLSK